MAGAAGLAATSLIPSVSKARSFYVNVGDLPPKEQLTYIDRVRQQVATSQAPHKITVFDEDWKGMVEALWKNLQQHIAIHPHWRDPCARAEDLALCEPICYRFCRALVTPLGEFTPSPQYVLREGMSLDVDHGDLAAPYFPDQDPLLIKKNVIFGVISPSEWTISGIAAVPTRGRRLKPVLYLDRIRDTMADFAVYNGIDAEVEMVSTIGNQAALDVLHEIRSDWALGGKVNVYAIYLPPYLSGNLGRRSFGIRYAKFAGPS